MAGPSKEAQISGKVVFVGNIPYGLTEERITEIFSSVGRVLSFRLVYDRETGRPKGFGFAEYQDSETAASAVRNLNNYEVQGRKLKVDYSHEGNAAEAAELEAMGGLHPSASASAAGGGGGGGGDGEVPEGLGVEDAISRTLAAVKPGQLFDIIVHMKQLVMQDAGKAAEILHQAPQHSYAIFQALLLMNLVDTTILTQAISGAAPAPPPPQPQVQKPVPVVAPPVPQQQRQPPPPLQPQQQQQGQVNLLAGLPDEQKMALIRQVMSLTPEQIGALPVQQQGAILDLRNKLLSGQL